MYETKRQKFIPVLFAVLMALIMLPNVLKVYAEDNDYSFSAATGELKIYTPAGVKAWESTILPADVKSIVIESAVTRIEGLAFQGLENLESLVFKGAIEIQPHSEGYDFFVPFNDTVKLKTISFGGDVILGANVFSYSSSNPNTALTELHFPGEARFINNNFTYCNELTKIVFAGNSVIQPLGNFCNLPKLKTVEFRDESQISLGNFQGSNNLETLIFSKKTTIGSNLFSNCVKLKELTFPAGSSFDSYVFQGNTALEKITFEGDVDLTKNNEFLGCTALKTLIFNGESKISNGAFGGASVLESITFDGKTELDSGAFLGNSKLKELIFPAGSTFGAGVFNNCTALEKITFMGDVDLTFGSIFKDATALRTIIFKGESKLGNYSFSGATHLKKISFAKKAQLGPYAFSGIGTALADKTDVIVLPDGSTVDSNAFYQSNLSGVEFKALTPQTFNKDIFFECEDGAVIYVPCVSVEAYATDLNGGDDPANSQGFEIKEVHDTSNYLTDANYHWKQCRNCHQSFNTELHVASVWIIDVPATQTADGTKHKECIVCSYIMETGVIPATGETGKDNPTTDVSPNPQTEDNNNMTLWFTLSLIGSAVAISTIVVSKKKKYNR